MKSPRAVECAAVGNAGDERGFFFMAEVRGVEKTASGLFALRRGLRRGEGVGGIYEEQMRMCVHVCAGEAGRCMCVCVKNESKSSDCLLVKPARVLAIFYSKTLAQSLSKAYIWPQNFLPDGARF